MAQNKNNNLDFLSKCAICSGEYQATDLTILEEKEQKTTLHVTCRKCHTSSIFFVSNGQAGILSLGMTTDLDSQEVKGKFSRQAVSADEVIDAHQYISQQGINLEKLFRS
ncbi:MAG: hypothetical protein WC238_05605 [Parcubacteria group bacterium]